MCQWTNRLIGTPRTKAVICRDGLIAAARDLPAPFITKHNQGGKGLGVRRFNQLDEFVEYVGSREFEPPLDVITLLQEYVRPREPFTSRIETVGFGNIST